VNALQLVGEPPCGGNADEPVLIRMASVEPQPLDWLWPGRIPAGRVSLLVGDPGQGKSLVAIDMAARVSRGLPWPDAPEGPPAPVGAVLLLSADDDLGGTVRPRLDAAGADAEAVVELCAVREGNGRGARRFCLARHLAALERALSLAGCVRLVVIDPVTAYLGRGEVASDAEVHDVLAPLAVVAGQSGAAILAVSHLSKRGAASVLHRATGSMAFVAAARTVWAVASDLDDPERHLFLPVKSNLSARGRGLAYRIVTSPEHADAPRLAWESAPVALTAAEALATVAGRPPSERQAAAAWLRDTLAAGPLAAQEVARRAGQSGVSWATVKRAKGLARVISYSTGYQDRWMWRLPGQEAQAPPGGEGAAETSGARVELPQGAEGAQGTAPDPRARPGGNAQDAAGRSAL